jgi:hypothetical protein
MADEDDDKPDPMWDELHNIPRCSEDDCRHYDGKRCKLMGFEPDGICEPAVHRMSEAIQVVLANPAMLKADRAKWLLSGIDMTAEEFESCGG